MSPYLFVPRAAFAHLDLSINRMICPYDLPYTWVLLNVLVGFTFLRAVHWLGLCEWPWDTLGVSRLFKICLFTEASPLRLWGELAPSVGRRHAGVLPSSRALPINGEGSPR